jgi:hypothetical protein
VKSLSATFARANKNFACFPIVGILSMLQESGCEHLARLQPLAGSSDASLLDDNPIEVQKIIGWLVQKWWSEHGLPEASRRLCKEPEMVGFDLRMFYVEIFCILRFILFAFC